MAAEKPTPPFDTFVFDVDGTLLTSDRRITPRTCAAVKQLAEKEIPFVVVSARSPSGIYPIFREYGISGERFSDTIDRLGFEYVEDQLLHGELDREAARQKEVKGGATC